MTDNLRHLLQQIVMHPADDTLRGMYADALDEEAGEATARGEFIRVQMELAKWRDYVAPPEILEIANSGRMYSQSAIDLITEKAKEHNLLHADFRRRERELLSSVKCTDWFTTSGLGISWTASDGIHGWYTGNSTIRVILTCGFISHITCTAEDFLKHADALVWNEGMTDECKGCKGEGFVWEDYQIAHNEPRRREVHCLKCNGGRTSRPMPDTAQPIEKVTLTTLIPNRGLLLGNCLLTQIVGGENRWKCETWKGIEFELPHEGPPAPRVWNPDYEEYQPA